MLRNTRKGFTLIELLIVVVIIGILAAIAIPKFANTKEKAYIAAMKSDLKNLVTAEEGYFADNATYASAASTATPTPAGSVNWGPSAPAGAVTFAGVSSTGWSATLTDPRVTSITSCRVFVGTPVVAGLVEGTPLCQ